MVRQIRGIYEEKKQNVQLNGEQHDKGGSPNFLNEQVNAGLLFSLSLPVHVRVFPGIRYVYFFIQPKQTSEMKMILPAHTPRKGGTEPAAARPLPTDDTTRNEKATAIDIPTPAATP